jgi:outer membrane protein TolC
MDHDAHPTHRSSGHLPRGDPRELYLRGLADFLTVLDTQRSVYAAEDDLVLSDRTVAVSLIALYKALGGGWDAASATEVPCRSAS